MRTRIPVAVLLFAWFAAAAWIRPLALPDEARYASVAWEMFASRNWAVPTLDGLPFFHKPPLFYWLADAAMAIFGVNAFAARVPSLLAATAVAWALYRFTRAHSGEAQARTTAVVTATTPYFYFGAQYANMDMLVAACIGCCVLLAAHAAIRLGEGRDARLPLWGAYAAAALGVLAKGLIGCVLPAGILFVWLLASRRAHLLRPLVSVAGLLVFAVITLPWFAAMELRHPGFLHFFIVEQHFARYASTGFNNPQPAWFYVPLLFALTLPWSAALVPAVLRRRTFFREPGRPVRTLMACWLGFVLVFFSIPHSKLIGYLLPAVPPAAWLLADAIGPAGPASFAGRHLRSIAAGAGVLVVAVVLFFALRAMHSARPLAEVLAGHRAAGEPVFFVDMYPYDLVYYARLRPPIPVVKDWSAPALRHTDAWPREFLDGAEFDAAGAATVLARSLPPRWDAGGAARAWVVTAPGAAPPFPQAQEVARAPELVLWRVDR